ncbi:hypothetical protein H0H93_010666 [Arthromyces matolae]|nr:hypothetical protein H0H93_010666 [Arthromyces matolae]
MAYTRRSPHQREPTSPSARKYPLRRSSPSRRRRLLSEELPHSTDIRRVLVPLHPNLRKLPSRVHLAQSAHTEKSDSHMARYAGVKRKRVTSTNTSNENVSHSTRTRARSKRLRSESLPSSQQSSYSMTSDGEECEEKEEEENVETEEEAASEMDIDASTSRDSDSESSVLVADEQDDDHADEDDAEASDHDGHDDSSDDYLVNSAPPKQLLRLRKDVLIRLYDLMDLPDDPETLTKSDIIAAIMAAREEEHASLPPSSPPARGDGYSSEGVSSDDGNEAGGEETDVGTGVKSQLMNGSVGLRRRATMGEVQKANQTMKGRSVSMGHVLPHSTLHRKGCGRSTTDDNSRTRRRSSNRSPVANSKEPSVSSPLATRLRSRKVSTSSSISNPMKSTRAKGKAKQVEFTAVDKTSSKRAQEKRQEQSVIDEESDLTSLEDLEASISAPSPRRLRSKDRESIQGTASSVPGKISNKSQRRTAKGKATNASARDDEEDNDTEEQEEDVEVDELEGDTAEEDEVDELISSASTTPVLTPQPVYKGRRTPLRTRLRPRRRHPPPPSDGDDEEDIQEENEEDVDEEEVDDDEEIDEEEEEIAEEDEEVMEDVGEGEDEEEVGEDEEEAGEDEEPVEEVAEEAEQDATESGDDDQDDTAIAKPRRLRSGKIVGDEDMNVEEDRTSEEDDDMDREVDEPEHTDDADAEAEDEVMESDDDVDLTIATAKTLVRLRRDDLVRLCESRELEAVGTKPQLAEALLQWRDRQANGFSSPSSCGTVRPSSNSRRRRRNGHKSSTEDPRPVLLRSGHTIPDEPLTPVPTEQQKEKEKEPDQELELDLESLGLEDREIPPDKIQKLEKIGSGGFKDVFIGKFKGRKIAISEFRGQLSSSTYNAFMDRSKSDLIPEVDIKELKLLGGFDHPNIVRFLGVSIPENTRETPVMIVSELCSNGDLFDYVRNVNPPSLHKVLVMMLDIARGLEYLHLRKPSVIHRDCKSSNILITAKGTAKIADFGLAKVKQSTRSMVRSLVGTVNWQAPELWHAHPKYNHKVDVFSCAMVFWEMLQWHLPNKKFPWEGMNEHAIYEIVGTKRQRPSVSGLRKQWCPEIVDLIERMWAQDHQDRPTMSEVVEALEEMVSHR